MRERPPKPHSALRDGILIPLGVLALGLLGASFILPSDAASGAGAAGDMLRHLLPGLFPTP